MRRRRANPPEKAQRSGWRVLAFVVVQVVIGLIVLEIALRVVGPRTGIRRLLYQPAAVTYYQSLTSVDQLLDQSIVGFEPFTESYGYVLNSKGLRTEEYTEEKPRDVHRVLAFGDSFTWASGGLPHEQHWPTILERKLHESMGSPVEVLRFGVPATGPDFQYRLWQIEGSRLDPDLVLLAFFVGNDFIDHRGRKATEGLREHSRLDLLSEISFTFRIARNIKRVAEGVASDHGHDDVDEIGGQRDRGGYPIADYARGYRPRRPTFKKREYFDIEGRRMALCLDEKEPAFENLLEKILPTIRAFRKEVEQMGARFVVVIIPDEYQIDRVLAEKAAEAKGRTIDEYDLERPTRRFVEALDAEAIEVVDLTPDFRRVGAKRRLYRIQDTHWNHDGNRLAAGLLDRYLTDAGTEGVVWELPDSISSADFEAGDFDGLRPSHSPENSPRR